MDKYISSNNQSCADNQQGRLDPWYIVGFTDGEGCFSISIFKNSTTKLGYQVFPEFVITQNAKSVTILEDIRLFFKCGNIYLNKRKDNHRENLYRYCVRSLFDIQDKIIPFFKQYNLKTNKKIDFEIFCSVIDSIAKKEHLTLDGLNKLRSKLATMNQHKIRN